MTRDNRTFWSRPLGRSLRRWLDLVILGVVSASFVYLLFPALEPVGTWLGRQSNSPWLSLAAIAVLGSVAVFPLFHVGSIGLPSLPRLRYPSITCSAVLGVALSLAATTKWFVEDAVLTVAAVAAAVAFQSAWRWLQRLELRRQEPPDRSSHDLLQQTPAATLAHLTSRSEALADWIADDEPVNDPEHDLLNVQHRVNRLRDALTEHRGKTIGLLGSYGTGKTSIIKMAETQLAATGCRSAPMFVRVELWGVRPEDMAAVVLRAAVDQLALHVDTLGLSGLPQHYSAALRCAGSRWSNLVDSIQSKSPLEQLLRLNEVMTALDRSMVFVLEDVDRVAPSQDLERLWVDLQALLDRLRRCSRLTFILALGHTRIDFDRLCDVKIEVPRLGFDQVGAVVQAFRYTLLSQAVVDGIILPTRTPRDLEAMKTMLPWGEEGFWDPIGRRFDPSLPVQNLVVLLATPRRLKSVLRHVEQAWKELKGEVELEELIIVETIRATAPQLIDTIVDAKREGANTGLESKDKQDKRHERIKRRLEVDLQGASAHERDALLRLASRISTVPFSDGESEFHRIALSKSAQSCIKNEVYWGRLWSGHIDDTHGPRDQSVLKTLRSWKRDRSSLALAERLESEEGFVLAFARLLKNNTAMVSGLGLSEDDVLELASGVNKILIAAQGADATQDASAAFDPLRRLAYESVRVSPDRASRWIREESARLLRHSLRLAMDVLYYWGDSTHSPLLQQQTKEARRAVIEHAREMAMDQQGKLFHALSSRTISHVFSVAHLVGARGQEAEFREHDSWTWLVDLLREAMSTQPERSAPLAAALALGGQHSTSPDEFGKWRVSAELQAVQACLLIPNHAERSAFFQQVLAALRSADRSSWDDLVKAWVDEAIKTLSTWIEAGVPCNAIDAKSSVQEEGTSPS